MNQLSLLLAGFLAVSALANADVEPSAKVPVVDLRVGLAQPHGEASYVQLDKGRVVGALVPLAGGATDPFDAARSSYLELRRWFEVSQKFQPFGCRRSAQRIATWLELESPNELARAPSAVGLWVTRGVRVFAVAGERDNELGTVASRFAPGPITGLTRAGRDVVARVVAEGALLDVSGASEPTIEDVIRIAAASHAPVIATHSNARALADHPRNLEDSTIRAIARTGGVIGVTATHGLLAPGRAPTLGHLVRQIIYLARVAGAEHVALGLGFESGAGPLRDFFGPRDLPRLAIALRNAGLSSADVARIFSGNALRVLCPPEPSPPGAP